MEARPPPPREQRLAAGGIPRHRHGVGYLTIVLDGGYLEAGGAGRWRLQPGDVVFHPAFEMHQNRIPTRGAWVVNVAAPPGLTLPAVFSVADADALARAIRTEPESVAGLARPLTVAPALDEAWADRLAADVRRDPSLSLAAWAAGAGLSPETLSRGFSAAFGVTPARYRAEVRIRRALQMLVADAPLSSVALDCGFADQAHLTREVRKVTGLPPGAWRRVNSVQDAPRAA